MQVFVHAGSDERLATGPCETLSFKFGSHWHTTTWETGTPFAGHFLVARMQYENNFCTGDADTQEIWMQGQATYKGAGHGLMAVWKTL